MMAEPDTNTRVTRRPSIVVAQVGDDHDAAVADFFREMWGGDATAESVRTARLSSDNPGAVGAVPAVAALIDGSVAGYIGTIPIRWQIGGEVVHGHWLKGFMVRPEYRNGPLGHAVLKEATKRLEVAAALTVADPSRRLFEALGYRNLGQLGNQVLLLRPARVASRLDVRSLGLAERKPTLASVVRMAQRTGLAAVGGALLAGALSVRAALSGRRLRRFSVQHGLAAATDAEIDHLDESVRRQLKAGTVRDASYLRWRYAEAPRGVYTSVLLRDGEALRGIGVVRLPRSEGDPRLKGIRVATLSDVMFAPDDEECGMAVVLAAARATHAIGADALLASASHPVLRDVLRRVGCFDFPGNVHFLLRDPRSSAVQTTLSDWWLTRGDANSDEVF